MNNKLGYIIGFILIIISFCLIGTGYILDKNKNIDKKENINVKISNKLKKNKVNTTLDLTSIFGSTEISGVENNTNNAIIHGDKIYYIYNTYECLYNSHESICKHYENCSADDEYCMKRKTYCDSTYNPNSLCKEFYVDADLEEIDQYINDYIFVSNLDGTNRKELGKQEDSELGALAFGYQNKDSMFLNNFSTGQVFKIGYDNNTEPICDTCQVAPYTSFGKNKVSIAKMENENMAILNVYNAKTMAKENIEIKMFNSASSDESPSFKGIQDHYDNVLYTTTNYKNDKELKKDSYGIYKNGKLVYSYKDKISIMFPTKNYIYLFLYNGRENYQALKINKKTFKNEKKINFSTPDNTYNCSKHLSNDNEKVYLYCDNKVYTFNENEEYLKDIDISFSNIIPSDKLNNYVFFVGFADRSEKTLTLVLYDSKNNTKQTIKNVVYYTIDGNKLYTVEDGRYEKGNMDYNNVNMYYYDLSR